MKVALFGNKTTTTMLLESLLRNGYGPDCVITLDAQQKAATAISGVDFKLERLCSENNIAVFHPTNYKMSNNRDLEFFLRRKFDVGICTGWQRLINASILNSFRHGVFGWHGSMFEFPNGRGRSPLNWSIRLGGKKIFHNLFQYAPGADNGALFETRQFSIAPTDYIEDTLQKAQKHMCSSSSRLLASVAHNELSLRPQPVASHITFPKLSESDGLLEPALMSTKTCCNITRACSRPFPGAFIANKGQQLFRIWKLKEYPHPHNLAVGNIELKNNTLFVAALDGILYSQDFVNLT